MKKPIIINKNSSIPKYRQIINAIIDEIANGNFKIGEKIPSINELSEDCYLSRDTVEKAYKKLKERKIIVSIKGKGYYTAKTDLISKVNIFLLINKLSSYKMQTYNSFVNSMGVNAQVNLFIYHCDESLFLNKIEKELGGYDYYVIMPHFKDQDLKHIGFSEKILGAIEKIPKNKLLLLDNCLHQVKGEYINIYQDFKLDIYNALNKGVKKLLKYKKIILIYPRKSIYPYPVEIIQGFRMFCVEHSFNFEIIDEIYDDMDLEILDCFITIDEMDLVSLVKQIREKEMVLGKEIGIISYNDTPLKELLGITVISTDFKVMGETAAKFILNKEYKKIKNPFNFIDRNSI